MSPAFVDLGSCTEAQRIKILINAVRDGQTIGFFVETNKKADRYLRQIEKQIPGLRVVYRGPFTDKSILVKIAPPVH